MKKIIIFSLFIIKVTLFSYSQLLNPVKWSFEVEKINAREFELVFIANIDNGWHLYGLNIPDGGPIATSFIYNDTTNFEFIGKPRAVIKPEVKFDDILSMNVELLEGKGLFKQRIKKLSDDEISISGYAEYMACNDRTCTPPLEAEFDFLLKGNTDKPDQTLNNQTSNENELVIEKSNDSANIPIIASQQVKKDSAKEPSFSSATSTTDINNKSLWGTFFVAILAGLAALLTPCVYPMIPLTVSFFMRGKKSRSKSILEAFVFGVSIVVIYTIPGILVAIFKNPNAVNEISTHWIPNLLFFLIFIVFAASFFGMFEITLPSGLANKVDKQADKGGLAGAFFMALGMTILSFSCTGPIVASLLMEASQGEVLRPVVGMFGFGLVFAIPFTLFAFFPSWLKGLPKSGGWLNEVKVFIAFILLAFSLYFLNKIDQAYHLNLLSREFYLSIWIVVFTLLGFYLLGKIRFLHDSELKTIGFFRLLLVGATFIFVVYMVPGLFGAELKGISILIPPKESQQFDLNNKSDVKTNQNNIIENITSNSLCSEPTYNDFLNLPHGLKGYFDYNEALSCAKEQNKPVLIDFVGHTCTNCKKMYNSVWSDPQVLEILNNEYIIVALYVDDKTKLPESKWYTSKVDGKLKKTIGKQNADFQVEKFNSNALPMYVIIDTAENILTKNPRYVYDPSVKNFINYLEEGIENFKK